MLYLSFRFATLTTRLFVRLWQSQQSNHDMTFLIKQIPLQINPLKQIPFKKRLKRVCICYVICLVLYHHRTTGLRLSRLWHVASTLDNQLSMANVTNRTAHKMLSLGTATRSDFQYDMSRSFRMHINVAFRFINVNIVCHATTCSLQKRHHSQIFIYGVLLYRSP